jgi:hypothetical protein
MEVNLSRPAALSPRLHHNHSFERLSNGSQKLATRLMLQPERLIASCHYGL